MKSNDAALPSAGWGGAKDRERFKLYCAVVTLAPAHISPSTLNQDVIEERLYHLSLKEERSCQDLFPI